MGPKKLTPKPAPDPLAVAAARFEKTRSLGSAEEQIQMALESIQGKASVPEIRSARSSLVRAIGELSTAMAMIEVVNLLAKSRPKVEEA